MCDDIIELSDRGFQVMLDLLNQMQTLTADDYNAKDISMDLDVRPDIIETIDPEKLGVMSKEEKRELFMRSRGNMRIDSDAIESLRERSTL